MKIVSFIFTSYYVADSAVSNPEDVLMSPVVMWSDIIKNSKLVEEVLVVCPEKSANDYEVLISAVHLECIHVVPLYQLSNEDLGQEQI